MKITIMYKDFEDRPFDDRKQCLLSCHSTLLEQIESLQESLRIALWHRSPAQQQAMFNACFLGLKKIERKLRRYAVDEILAAE